MKATILIVDDERLIRWSLVERLSAEGYETLEAESGQEALARFGAAVDLFYRLNVLPIRLPPLRDRAEDVPVLARFFADSFSREPRKAGATLSAARRRAPGASAGIRHVDRRPGPAPARSAGTRAGSCRNRRSTRSCIRERSLSLSARVAPEFYKKSDDVGNVPHAGALRTTLDDLRGSAVFCVQDVPTIVLLSVDEYNPAAISSLCSALWNQGLASLLIVLSGETVRVFSLARIPRSGDEDTAVTRCLVEQLHAAADALALRNLIYAAESGR